MIVAFLFCCCLVQHTQTKSNRIEFKLFQSDWALFWLKLFALVLTVKWVADSNSNKIAMENYLANFKSCNWYVFLGFWFEVLRKLIRLKAIDWYHVIVPGGEIVFMSYLIMILWLSLTRFWIIIDWNNHFPKPYNKKVDKTKEILWIKINNRFLYSISSLHLMITSL